MNRKTLIRLALCMACLAPAGGMAQHARELLDPPARRLQISVRFDEARESSRTRIEAAGRVDERGARAGVQARTIQRSSAGRVEQRVQVLEGSRAVIYTGRSRPVRQYIQTPGGVIPQQVTIVQDETTGFAVVPRLAGSEVVLDLGEGQSVSAELGQWIELGRSSTAARYRTELQGVWLKVDELPR